MTTALVLGRCLPPVFVRGLVDLVLIDRYILAGTRGPPIEKFPTSRGGGVGGGGRLGMGVGKLFFNFCSRYAGSRETRCK